VACVAVLALYAIALASATTTVHVHETFDDVPGINGLVSRGWKFAGPAAVNSSAGFVLQGLRMGNPTNPADCTFRLNETTVSVDLKLDSIPAGSRAHLSFLARAFDKFGTAHFIALINTTGALHDADLSWQLSAGHWGWRAVAADVSRFVGKGPVRLLLQVQFELWRKPYYATYSALDTCRQTYLHIDDLYGLSALSLSLFLTLAVCALNPGNSFSCCRLLLCSDLCGWRCGCDAPASRCDIAHSEC
jgi:hypothetical protein